HAPSLSPDATPKWIPITVDELEVIEKAGLPLHHQPKTKEQSYNQRRLRISNSLGKHSKNPSTAQLIAAICNAEAQEDAIARDLLEQKRQAAAYRAAHRVDDREDD